ncbi:MAG: cysteine rich repeat-containing protein [Bdellovibrionia bacterium]
MICFNTIAQCTLIVGFLFLIPSHSSFAHENSKKGTCIEDAKKFCSNMHWGKGLGNCLLEHKTELSEECANKMTGLKAPSTNFQAACGDDISEFCGNIPPSRGRVMGCLRANETHLTSKCRLEIQGLGINHGDAINQNFGTS